MQDNQLLNKILGALLLAASAVAFISLTIQWIFLVVVIDAAVINLIDVIILAVFLLVVTIRFLKAPSKIDHLKRNWIDLVVIIALVQCFRGVYIAGLVLVFRQLVLLLRLSSKAKLSQRLISLLGLQPAQLLIVSFLMTILIGTFLLTLPVSSTHQQGLGFIDALFTATSATCVTGLIVKDTGVYFSLFGQLVILALIQIGALGIMTFSVTLFLAMGKRMSNKEAMAMQDVLDQDSMAGIYELIGFIAKMTIGIEVLGMLFLYVGFEPFIADPGQRLYAAFFHSISAFCNAGFSIFSDSLVKFATNPTINLTIAFLIIFGGLGFIVVKDVLDKYVKGKRAKSLGLKVHTKLVLTMTIALIILGTIFIYFAENSMILKDMATKDKLLISFFQSVSTRTAGFNSVDIGMLSNASIFIMIILMFIGASSGSTAGGIKITTFWVILKSFTNNLQNKDKMNAFKRKIPDEIVGKAIAIFVLSLGLVIVFMYLVSIFEALPFRDLIFEVVSAFGTVGLSTGITAQLHAPGKLLITILMFLGRLGPLTIVLAFSGYKRKIDYTYAEERIMVG